MGTRLSRPGHPTRLSRPGLTTRLSRPGLTTRLRATTRPGPTTRLFTAHRTTMPKLCVVSVLLMLHMQFDIVTAAVACKICKREFPNHQECKSHSESCWRWSRIGGDENGDIFARIRILPDATPPVPDSWEEHTDSSTGKKYWMTKWHERHNALPDWGQWSMSYCPDDKPQKGVIGPAKTASPWQVFESGKPGEVIDGFHKGLSDDGRSPSCYNKQLETCKCHEVIVKAKRANRSGKCFVVNLNRSGASPTRISLTGSAQARLLPPSVVAQASCFSRVFYSCS